MISSPVFTSRPPGKWRTLCASGALYLVSAIRTMSAQAPPQPKTSTLAAGLLQINLASNALISVSFLALSVIMLVLWKRSGKNLPHPWVVGTFGLFVLACALSQAMQLLIVLHPLSWMIGTIEILTTALALCIILLLPRMVRDFIELFRSAGHSQQNEARFLATAESSMDAVFLLDAVRDPAGEIEDFRFTYLNQRAQQLFNIPNNDVVVGAKLCELLPSYRSEGFFDQYKQVVLTGKPSTSEFSIKDAQINATWLRYSIVKLADGIAVAASDLTSQKEAENKIRHMAQHDPLTGLPNRTLLDDRIQQAIERAIRYRQNAAVLLLDLDTFKSINDTYGHAAGDEVLKTVAARLRSAVRATDSVFRLGGDEFVIVLGDLATKGPIVDFTRKIFVSLLPPIPWEDQALNISASIGVANYPGDGATPEALLVQADIAMYRMKRGRASTADLRSSQGA
ncbi:GGDEF domain-containing protein [Granulicella tundricola]|uniref:Diguanylate cyclase n=1 Tax=Granulicella tundricola (strain ATCC BAA-1859 / DSM 23138 / MP5ACTX9) TaxID=1198114 RepID=E8WZ06_GRATM|nr:GGDEF domain-containing protein [Granulicella tundricola]ADW69921.1 diguanylate cyclase [Granulicella tundricola MP5ACTX9]